MTRTDLIRELLRRRGWTHEGLALRLGVTQQTVSKWFMEGDNRREPGESAWRLILEMWRDPDLDPASTPDPTAR